MVALCARLIIYERTPPAVQARVCVDDAVEDDNEYDSADVGTATRANNGGGNGTCVGNTRRKSSAFSSLSGTVRRPGNAELAARHHLASSGGANGSPTALSLLLRPQGLS